MKLSKPALVTGIILALVLFFALWVGGNYNSLNTAKNNVDNSWAKVETEYQRRLDLVDQYVSVAKSTQTQEKAVFGDIAKARQQYASASTPSDKAQAASNIESINIVPRLQEAYPELKSNVTLNNLATEISGTENGIRDRRNDYNDKANAYNIKVTKLPNVFFAAPMGFDKVSRRSTSNESAFLRRTT
jgi:LemA protein